MIMQRVVTNIVLAMICWMEKIDLYNIFEVRLMIYSNFQRDMNVIPCPGIPKPDIQPPHGSDALI